jgi:predicted aspartyl protease
LVDSGAIYSGVQGKILDQMGIEPSFSLADGTTVKRKISSAYFEFEGGGGRAPVVYGEEGDTQLLGATTFESIGSVLNPFTRILHSMRRLMALLKNNK